MIKYFWAIHRKQKCVILIYTSMCEDNNCVTRTMASHYPPLEKWQVELWYIRRPTWKLEFRLKLEGVRVVLKILSFVFVGQKYIRAGCLGIIEYDSAIADFEKLIAEFYQIGINSTIVVASQNYECTFSFKSEIFSPQSRILT